ncbi:MAG: disulfide bond formation protein B [Rhodospirillales bacterium]|nr:disulfide bond formation protein B [Rhodospirillales bacterium]
MRSDAVTLFCAGIEKRLSCPFFVSAGIAGISVFSLLSAFTAQYAFGLEPCILCLYQRVPFVLTTIFGLAGLVLARKGRVGAVSGMVGLSAAAFAVNAGIAFYHSGVERHWWRSAFEACRIGDFSADDAQGLLDKIMKMPSVPCDSIPWADPVLGLSMANYNAMMCAGLALGCALCAWLIARCASR